MSNKGGAKVLSGEKPMEGGWAKCFAWGKARAL